MLGREEKRMKDVCLENHIIRMVRDKTRGIQTCNGLHSGENSGSEEPWQKSIARQRLNNKNSPCSGDQPGSDILWFGETKSRSVCACVYEQRVCV